MFPKRETPLAIKGEDIVCPHAKVWAGVLVHRLELTNQVDIGYDGDTVSALFLYSNEAMEEITKKLKSRDAYIDPAGGLRTGASVDTVNLVLRNLTGNYPTID